MSNDSKILSIKNLTVRFGDDRVIDDISFDIETGSTVALVGESGSGKSMTALAIMQLLPLAAKVDAKNSYIFFEGDDLLTKSELTMRKLRGDKIALVFQEAITALNPVLTIAQQIEEVLKAHTNLNRNERLKKIIHLLNEVGIVDPEQVAKSYPHQLSGGMKQRAMIACALAGEPDLLIADEPTTALDVTIQAQVIDLLKRLQQKRKMSVLFITHDLGIVYQIADYVVVMQKGKIVEQNNTNEFFQNPTHEYSKHLFNSIPGEKNRPERAAKTTKNILTVNDLKIYYPIRKGVFKKVVGHVKAVDGVNFDLHSGKTLALVGESGSGKTTVGMGILQLIQTTSGNVLFDGKDVAHIKAHELNLCRKDFQIIFQDPYSSMNPRMMIRDIVLEGMRAQNMTISDDRAGELLSMVGLDPEFQYRYPHEFSGGQRQRICIARALAVEPKLIICDEPTSALDVSVQMHILKLLIKLQEKFNLAYLLITHDFSVVAFMADQVAVMYHGKIVEQGEVMDILKEPQDEYTKRLLASVPTIELEQ